MENYMKCKAVFLDRDGTINIDKNYVYKIDDFEFIPGVIKALKLFQEKGYKLFIITNQSGIARGYYTEEDFHILNNWMLSQLEKNNINIESVYYCPHLDEAKVLKYKKNCTCRKPNLGLFYKAIEEFDIDLNQSIVIGDKERDIAISKISQCRGYIVDDKSINKSLLSIAKTL